MKNFLLILIISAAYPDSYNMDLMSFMSFGQDVADITGFAQDNREFAVIGLQSSAAFVDITDPSNPFEVGRISGGNSIWRDLKYWDRHVYIGTEAQDGVKVVSVDNPDNPTLVNTITDFTNSHNIHVDTDGYLYVIGAGGHDMWIYNLSNPAQPQLVGYWDEEYLHDIEVYNNKVYGAGIYSGIFYIIDVTDKSNPYTLVSYNTGGGYISTHDCAITEDEQFLITADENTGGHIKIWDISNYDNINLVSEYMTSPNHSSHNIYVRPGTNLLIISYYADGTRILDISDPYNPLEVAWYDTTEIEGLYVGNWGVYAYLPSGYLVSSDIESGMYVLMCPLIVSPPELSYNAGNIDFTLAEGETDFGNITITNVGDVESTLNYSLTTSPFSTTGGSDSFGNIWSDSEINEEINYNWVEISGEGTVVNFSNNDVGTNLISMDFDFPFYDNLYSAVRINPNGWVGFGSDNEEWDNSSIPDSNAPLNAIMGLWDDLNPENDNCNQYCSGNVYYHGDENRFVVWFDDVAHWWTNFENSYYDFQFVLYADGEIHLNYRNIEGDHDATIGMQNSDASDGLQVSFNTDYANNNKSLVFNAVPEWLTLTDGTSGSLEYNQSASHGFEVDAVELTEGNYSAYIRLLSNGGAANIPISLIVDAGSEVVLGDVNFDGAINILDVVITVNFILGTDDPAGDEFTAADLNSDGVIDILDIVLLINFIIG